jgi:hypothetical protein
MVTCSSKCASMSPSFVVAQRQARYIAFKAFLIEQICFLYHVESIYITTWGSINFMISTIIANDLSPVHLL